LNAIDAVSTFGALNRFPTFSASFIVEHFEAAVRSVSLVSCPSAGLTQQEKLVVSH
jgi:hypothetical protein